MNLIHYFTPGIRLGFALLAIMMCGCEGEPLSKKRARPTSNHLYLKGEAKFGGFRSVGINPPSDLNGKARRDLYGLRKEFVLRHPDLAAADYEPSRVFESIEDGKPWWGFGGWDHHGPGAKSNEGISTHSRFINNPFLLVGLSEHYILWNLLGVNGEDPPHLLPSSLEWRSDSAQAAARYEVGKYFDFLSRTASGFDRELELIGYNARDFGLNYLWVDGANSKNIAWQSDSVHAIQIPQYIHCGGSCGNPASCCNNMSPAPSRNFRFTVKDLPAKISMKLWFEKPYSYGDHPDMTFVLELH